MSILVEAPTEREAEQKIEVILLESMDVLDFGTEFIEEQHDETFHNS